MIADAAVLLEPPLSHLHPQYREIAQAYLIQLVSDTQSQIESNVTASTDTEVQGGIDEVVYYEQQLVHLRMGAPLGIHIPATAEADIGAALATGFAPSQGVAPGQEIALSSSDLTKTGFNANMMLALRQKARRASTPVHSNAGAPVQLAAKALRIGETQNTPVDSGQNASSSSSGSNVNGTARTAQTPPRTRTPCHRRV